MPDLIRLAPFTEEGDVRVVVETPRGSQAKFAYDPEIQTFAFKKSLLTGLTYPHDWVLFKAEDRITGYCQDAGCQRFSDIWGIEIYNLSDWDRTEDPETKDFSWTIAGDGLSKRTGQTVVGIS